jgi:hypothetical protein
VKKKIPFSWRDLFSFDRFIFPKVATAIWILFLIWWSVTLVKVMSIGMLSFSILIILLLALLGVRLFVEMMVILWKIYEKV